MAVDGVNNSNNNTAFYTAGAATVGAGVLGLGTLLCCAGKKQPEQPQNIDQQA